MGNSTEWEEGVRGMDANRNLNRTHVAVFLNWQCALPTHPHPSTSSHFANMDPLTEWDEDQFEDQFRMPKAGVDELVQVLEDDLDLPNAYSPELQVQMAVTYMRQGSAYQSAIAMMFGASQSTVSRTIQRVANSMIKNSDRFIRFPRTNAVCCFSCSLSHSHFG